MLKETENKRETIIKNEMKIGHNVEQGCGIVVRKKILVATIKGVGIKEETRKFSTYSSSLEELKKWLLCNKVSHVAMENTGKYWKQVYNILEGNFNILLVNARHIKKASGRITEKTDAKWITKILLSGLLKGSFIFPQTIRELRDLTRYKQKIIQTISAEKNRIQKVFEEANIKISWVLSNFSVTKIIKIIDTLINGVEDIEELLKLCYGEINVCNEKIKEGLKGKLRKHHKFMLSAIKVSITDNEKIIKLINEEIDDHLKKNQLEEEVEIISKIHGVGREDAIYIIADIVADMNQFSSEVHLASWTGLSPNNN